MLKFEHQYSSTYYPQGNDQVEAIRKILKTMLQRMVDKHKTNLHDLLFFSLWAYCTLSKFATGFTPFHLVHDVDSVFPIECQIPSFRLVVELLRDTSPLEKLFLTLEQIIKDPRISLQIIEANKTQSKSPYDSLIHPCTFNEGDLILAYN